jgi:glycosyltransferase involved in cell wall biosynthesis
MNGQVSNPEVSTVSRFAVGKRPSRPKRSVRIAVVNSHPIQYFAPLYAYLNAQADLEVTALYLSDTSIRGGKDADFGQEVKWDLDLLAGYPSLFIGDAGRREPRGFWSLVAPQIWNELRSGRYDVLWLHGHYYAANLIALMAAKSRGLPVFMRGESHLGLPRGPVKTVLRRPLMKTVYRLCDRFLAIGSANTAFYRAMGVSEDKIFLVPYSVDNDRFTNAAGLTQSQRADVRQRYKIPTDRPAILFASKLTPRKRPTDLLEAARRLKQRTKVPHAIVIAGSGELDQELRDFCTKHSIDNVVFLGFINQSELPRLYGASDIFVLPSENEPWGLAVNEAMCAGLPVVVSRGVGCVADLVGDGVNGYTPPLGDLDALAEAMRRLVEDENLRREQGRASLARISRWGFRECAEGIRGAVASLKFAVTAN